MNTEKEWEEGAGRNASKEKRGKRKGEGEKGGKRRVAEEIHVYVYVYADQPQVSS